MAGDRPRARHALRPGEIRPLAHALTQPHETAERHDDDGGTESLPGRNETARQRGRLQHAGTVPRGYWSAHRVGPDHHDEPEQYALGRTRRERQPQGPTSRLRQLSGTTTLPTTVRGHGDGPANISPI